MNHQPYPTQSRHSLWHRSFLHLFTPLCVAISAAFCPVQVSAETTGTDEARLQQIEQQIAALQSEVRATRQRMSGQRGAQVQVNPPAEGPLYDGKDSKVVLPAAPEPEARWHFFIGADARYMQPRWTVNPAYGVDNNSDDDDDDSQNPQENFSHDFEVAPGAHVGVVSPSGLGFRASWWGLYESDATKLESSVEDDDRTIHSAAPLGLGLNSDDDDDNYEWQFDSELEINHVIDGEVTYQAVQSGGFGVLLFGGARYVDTEQSYDVDRLDTDDDDDDDLDIIRSKHDFQGFGPTFGAEATYTFGNSGFGLYSNGRTSVLFGERTQWASRTFDVADDEDTEENWSKQDSFLTMGEVEGGFAYKHDWGRWGLNLRAGVIGQVWWDNGNSSNSENIIGTNVPDESSDPSSDMALLGFKASAGIDF